MSSFHEQRIVSEPRRSAIERDLAHKSAQNFKEHGAPMPIVLTNPTAYDGKSDVYRFVDIDDNYVIDELMVGDT
jgi:hypothetical protein